MKKIIKKIFFFFIKKDSSVYRWMYYTFHWSPKGEINSYLKKKFRDRQVKFIQIGANDGITGDDIYGYIKRYNWEGILIEPVDYLFKSLKKTYRKHKGKLYFENIAISIQKGSLDFYYVDQYKVSDKLPAWLNQLGSFNRDQVLWVESKYPGTKVISKKVFCDTINAVAEKYGITTLDLLYIDTEGYDFEIIKSINFSNLRPELIFYEHRHLSAEEAEACEKLLEGQNYFFIKEKYNTLAVYKDKL